MNGNKNLTKDFAVKKIIILVFVLFALSSCNKKYDNESKNISLKNDCYTGKEYAKEVKFIKSVSDFPDLFEQQKIIHLETEKRSLIGRIDNLIYLPKQKRIVILDNSISKCVLIFDVHGKFITRIGSNGKGPGEFVSPKSVAYGNNTLVIYSEELLKLLFYKLDGSFLKEIRLSQQGWRFAFDKMVINGKDLYGYTNNIYFNEDPHGNKHRVFKIKDFTHFENAYGEVEDTYGIGDGNIVCFNGKVIFPSIFSGDIYQVSSDNKKTEVFSKLGVLTNTKDIATSKNPIQFIRKNFGKMDYIWKLGVVKQFLFVVRPRKISVIDLQGNVINHNLKWGLKLPKGYEGVSITLGFVFYHDGIIIASTEKAKIIGNAVPNPSLIFYRLSK